jgi:aminopeptidase
LSTVTDPRLAKLARVLVDYSVRIRPGHLVRLSAPTVAVPLVLEIYRAVLEAGGHPLMRLAPDGADEVFYRYASPDQLRHIPKVRVLEEETIDAHIGIWANVNTRSLTSADPKRMAARREALRPINDKFLERAAKEELRWVGTQFPTYADAQEADMSLAEWEEFVFAAGMLDREDPVAAWTQMREELTRVAGVLTAHDRLELRGKDIDLTVRAKGRKWIVAAGEYNFPDGEIFTGPIEDSVEGRVRFSYPAVYNGRIIEGIELTFERGRVVDARAERGEEFLLTMLDMDAGARMLGEFAFGLNYSIGRFTRNILFDEKIGGTVHMALGAGYPETGSANKSALHWDMICDLREGGEVRGDGKVIYRDGRFVA